MVSALVLIADGTEEMEFTITYDTLVRAGVNTTSAFVNASEKSEGTLPQYARCSRGLKIIPDTNFDLLKCGPENYDLFVIPGGADGAKTMSQNEDVQALVREFLKEKKFVGMICAGSLTALTAGLPRQLITSHPSVKSHLVNGFDYSEDSVVVSGYLITRREGTAFPFALTLVELLCGSAKRKEVYNPMVFPLGTPF
ncbi:class I glutamine amidotransferase-like protein [Collybia nuda]|uniref:D-lactate dehydratase n=1 Tax=Collybia nuda TaxID=64659 RepID=A0A9P5Y3A6_9AGAR|nr:class I glutamine amidotransferase-like protein [Collybia nuda]